MIEKLSLHRNKTIITEIIGTFLNRNNVILRLYSIDSLQYTLEQRTLCY